MSEILYDNSLGQLGAPVGASDTSITFTGSPGWATLTGDDYIKLVLDPPTSTNPVPNPLFEVVYVTAYTGGDSTGTISRGEGDTTPVAHDINATWLNAPTAADFNSGGGTVDSVEATDDTIVVDNTDPANPTIAVASGIFALLTENVNTVATSGAAQTIPAVTDYTINNIVLSENCTLTFPAAEGGDSLLLQVVQPASGGPYSATWPGSGIAWVAGIAPTQAVVANNRDLYSFVCIDGTNYAGIQISPSGGY
jgi:hypothetical protein